MRCPAVPIGTRRFSTGWAARSTNMRCRSIGGDTVALPPGAPRVLSLTAIGLVPAGGACPTERARNRAISSICPVPWANAGAGLELLRAGEDGPAALIAAYRTPEPHLALGQTFAPVAHAMMDISDGLLIDARRMAEASGCAIEITSIPLSADYAALHGLSVASRLAAATAGDDYVLLAALPPNLPPPEGLVAVGRCAKGAGLTVVLDGAPVTLPDRLGYEHGPVQSASANHP